MSSVADMRRRRPWFQRGGKRMRAVLAGVGRGGADGLARERAGGGIAGSAGPLRGDRALQVGPGAPGRRRRRRACLSGHRSRHRQARQEKRQAGRRVEGPQGRPDHPSRQRRGDRRQALCIAFQLPAGADDQLRRDLGRRHHAARRHAQLRHHVGLVHLDRPARRLLVGGVRQLQPRVRPEPEALRQHLLDDARQVRRQVAMAAGLDLPAPTCSSAPSR